MLRLWFSNVEAQPEGLLPTMAIVGSLPSAFYFLEGCGSGATLTGSVAPDRLGDSYMVSTCGEVDWSTSGGAGR